MRVSAELEPKAGSEDVSFLRKDARPSTLNSEPASTGALPRTPIGRPVASAQPMNPELVFPDDEDRRHSVSRGVVSRFPVGFGPSGRPCRHAPGCRRRIRKADGRRSEGVGDARKVIGRCLPPASYRREFRTIDDQRLKSTSEGVPATVRRWPAGTEGGAKAPACDGRANFIEGVMA